MSDRPDRDIFDRLRLPPALDEAIRAANPWWEQRPGRPVPSFRRTLFPVLLRKLKGGAAPVVVVRGARQLGKTTLQLQLIDHLLREEGVAARQLLRVQFDDLQGLRGLDDPILALIRWYENRILGESINEAAHGGRTVFLLLDEVQNLDRWAAQLKHLVDHNACQVAVTGSSALRIAAGEDSLAGRLDLLEIGTLSLREIAGLRGNEHFAPYWTPNGRGAWLERDFWLGLSEFGADHASVRDDVFQRFTRRGGYPLAHKDESLPWEEVADQLAEIVVRRVIRHDLRMGEVGRKRDERLLEEVFRLACRYAGQAPTIRSLADEIRTTHDANVGDERVRNYLDFLGGALLVRLIRPLEVRLKKQRSAPKICLVDHAIRAAYLGEDVSIAPEDLASDPASSELAGHLAESIVGAHLSSITHLDLSWFPERSKEPEVDFVVTEGTARIPIEVKYRSRLDPKRDLVGMTSFLDRDVYGAAFGVVVTREEHPPVEDPRIIPVSLRNLLMMT